MIRMKIGVSPLLEELAFFLNNASKRTLPNTSRVMEEAAKHIQSVWQAYATGAHPLPDVKPLKNGSNAYAKSIRTEQVGHFGHEIYSEAKIADWIENGTERLDMKITHTKGPRSRVSKKGVPYLIVPFQWGTGEKGSIRSGPKNIVPKQLLTAMRNRKFKQSTVENGTYLSPNQSGQMVERWTYTWGGRARGADFAGTVEQKSYADGMVRFEEGEKGGRRYGGHFTFRVISADSPADSWIKPATPGRYVTKGVQKYTEDTVSGMAQSGLMKDIGR